MTKWQKSCYRCPQFYDEVFTSLEAHGIMSQNEDEKAVPVMNVTGRGRKQLPKLSKLNPPNAAYYTLQEGRKLGKGRGRTIQEKLQQPRSDMVLGTGGRNAYNRESTFSAEDPALSMADGVSSINSTDNNSSNASMSEGPSGPLPIRSFQQIYGHGSPVSSGAYHPMLHHAQPCHQLLDVGSASEFPALSSTHVSPQGKEGKVLSESCAVNFKTIADELQFSDTARDSSILCSTSGVLEGKVSKEHMVTVRITQLPSVMKEEDVENLKLLVKGYGELSMFEIVSEEENSVATIRYDNEESFTWLKECLEDPDAVFEGHTLKIIRA